MLVSTNVSPSQTFPLSTLSTLRAHSLSEGSEEGTCYSLPATQEPPKPEENPEPETPTPALLPNGQRCLAETECNVSDGETGCRLRSGTNPSTRPGPISLSGVSSWTRILTVSVRTNPATALFRMASLASNLLIARCALLYKLSDILFEETDLDYQSQSGSTCGATNLCEPSTTPPAGTCGGETCPSGELSQYRADQIPTDAMRILQHRSGMFCRSMRRSECW
jgi:hypothetical protein